MARILVVDDESDLRFIVRALLERAGHQVVDAADGRRALDRLEEDRVDVIVTDLQMPVLDGRGLVEQVRADDRYADTPIILWSGQPDRSIDVDAIVPKPYLGEGLLEHVDRLVEGRPR